jgi:hypothetical protein
MNAVLCSMARLDLLAWVLEPSRINFIFRRSGLQMYSLLSDSLIVFASLLIFLAPMTLVLDRPGGAGWKLLTFLCCALAAGLIVFTSSQLIALVAWVLAWACAMAMQMSFYWARKFHPS